MEIQTRMTTAERAQMMLQAWVQADDDDYIETRLGASETGAPCIAISIGEMAYPFTQPEAVILIKLCRERLGGMPGVNTLIGALERSVAALPAFPSLPSES